MTPKGPTPRNQRTPQRDRWRGLAIVWLFCLFAFAVHGFHPFAEDGGLYAAGIKRRLDPGLYAPHPEFVLAHLRFSPFAGFVAELTRAAHLPLEWVLLVLYVGSLWATLHAGWMVACRATPLLAARCGAVALLACSMTLPIAGTSLLLVDPYLTARSFSTPLALAAIAWALDALHGSRRGALLCAAALVLATVHPLMAAYALASVLVLAATGAKNPALRRWGVVTLAACALAAAAVLKALAAPETPAYVQAALSRYYWFPALWHWYELVGLAAPLALLALLGALGRARQGTAWRLLAHSAILLGGIAAAVAIVFARASASTHLVARLQPLRSFQMVYEILLMLLGAWLGEHWLQKKPWRWAALLLALGGVMLAVQRATFPVSRHIEWPTEFPRSPWVQAFVWIRNNTPRDAVFALDAHYITRPEEEGQGFRAIAERSTLPDYSKDGGEASITPVLAEPWAAGVAAQLDLDSMDDATRAGRLHAAGANWAVLPRVSVTAWPCPYRNAAVQVCRVP